jgi:hypothetical protein
MGNDPRVGGEADAFCTKCKMLLGHTILAMVGTRVARVRCNTCQGEHNFRKTEAKARAPRAPAGHKHAGRAAAEAAAKGGDLDSLLKGRDISQPLRYQAGQAFAKDAILHHPAFGLGIVLSVRGEKMDVMFEGGLKTLAQQRGLVTQIKRLHEATQPESAEEMAGDQPA